MSDEFPLIITDQAPRGRVTLLPPRDPDRRRWAIVGNPDRVIAVAHPDDVMDASHTPDPDER